MLNFFFFYSTNNFSGGKQKHTFTRKKKKEPVKESLKLYPLIFFVHTNRGRGEKETPFLKYGILLFFLNKIVAVAAVWFFF